MASEGFGSWHHLAGRFFGALSPAGPPQSDEAWARGSLLEGEQVLWARMSGPDRRHAVGVARETIRLLDDDHPPRQVVAAALLHDVGKVEASLGTFARVGVTLAAMAAGRKRLLDWAGQPQTGPGQGGSGEAGLQEAGLQEAGPGETGPGEAAPARDGASPTGRSVRSRVGLYLAHDRVGAELLASAGSHDLTVTWAREHHMPPTRWTVDRKIGGALKEADGD
ncbi:MAG TPA: HD domain-containing protein [Acidimicrobiales bacterium]|nr:HD domain-containing protein [Acidimicrobiales bacterium]